MPMSLMAMSSSASPACSPWPGPAASLPEDARGWLKAAAGPGRGRLRRAAAWQALETVFLMVQWAGLASVAQVGLARRAVPAWPALVMLGAGGLLAAAAARARGSG